jgi:hypothetical protein
MNIGTLIAYYQRGAYTAGELAFKAALLITPETVEEILCSVPEETLKELRSFAFTPATAPKLLLAGNISPQEAQRIEEHLASAVPLIRNWFSKREIQNPPRRRI